MEEKKIAPKVLIQVEDFDISIGDIPLAIHLPPQEKPKEKIHKSINQKSISLF